MTAVLPYTSNRGRSGRYTTTGQADDSGRYELRLAYASRGSPPGVRADGPYRVRAGGTTRQVSVEEPAVRSGALVPGPDFP